MDILFKDSSNFSSLSIKDLLQARDLFHYHLMNKKNVVATAIGLYRIRKDDAWPSAEQPTGQERTSRKHSRRTLFNSQIRPYSWPCVYAFVSSWETEEDLAKDDPSDMVPKSLYLPDGRTVPVCVIETRRQEISTGRISAPFIQRPRNYLCPGSPIINKDGQGLERVGTAGCIVSDSGRFYLMTNSHVIGAPGTTIHALQPNRCPRIGHTSKNGLVRENLELVYPGLPSTRQRLRLDVGLVELDDIRAWQTAVPGITPVGDVLDLYDNNFSLQLIRQKVAGQAARSGLLRGEIHALFYRHKSMGGSEYITDFLIGPETYVVGPDGKEQPIDRKEGRNENISFAVDHGDSGTLLFIEQTAKAGNPRNAQRKTVYYPFALLWGREAFFEGDGKAELAQPFALATALSPALDMLDLDLVQNINRNRDFTWGWLGHMLIGRALNLPGELLAPPSLKSFVETNIELLSVQPNDDATNDPKVTVKGDPAAHYVALADVPDNVWKSNVNHTGSVKNGTYKLGPGNRGQDDNPNHFADLDLPYLDGKTFLELNLTQPDTYLRPSVWVQYFAAIKPQEEAWAQLLGPTHHAKRVNWGALPFRVHQLFDIMVAAAKQRKPDAKLFLCAGGVLIHYLGDACQPLHSSYMSNGDPADVIPDEKHPGENIMRADGVHSGYEDEMIEYGFVEKGLSGLLQKEIGRLAKKGLPKINSGYEASKAVIELIDATQKTLSPRTIVEKWNALPPPPYGRKLTDDQKAALWEDLGAATVTCMARGTLYLAAVWQGAWSVGGADSRINLLEKIDPQDIMALYNDPDVAPSVPLDSYLEDRNADWSAIKRPAKAKAP